MKGNGDAQIRIEKHPVQWRCGGLKLKHKLCGLKTLMFCQKPLIFLKMYHSLHKYVLII